MDKLLGTVGSLMLLISSIYLWEAAQDIKRLEGEVSAYKHLIREYEENLPRDKTCKLIAVESE